MHSHIYRRDFASLNAKSLLYIGERHHLNSEGYTAIDSHIYRRDVVLLYVKSFLFIQERCCVAIRKIIPLYIGVILRCYTQNLSSLYRNNFALLYAKSFLLIQEHFCVWQRKISNQDCAYNYSSLQKLLSCHSCGYMLSLPPL